MQIPITARGRISLRSFQKSIQCRKWATIVLPFSNLLPRRFGFLSTLHSVKLKYHCPASSNVGDLHEHWRLSQVTNKHTVHLIPLCFQVFVEAILGAEWYYVWDCALKGGLCAILRQHGQTIVNRFQWVMERGERNEVCVWAPFLFQSLIKYRFSQGFFFCFFVPLLNGLPSFWDIQRDSCRHCY